MKSKVPKIGDRDRERRRHLNRERGRECVRELHVYCERKRAREKRSVRDTEESENGREKMSRRKR
jgi:hypothetical protein